jgi:hypothetical protein
VVVGVPAVLMVVMVIVGLMVVMLVAVLNPDQRRLLALLEVGALQPLDGVGDRLQQLSV